VAARLAAGERVMVPLQLAEPAAGKQQLLPGGLGGQVRSHVVFKTVVRCLVLSKHAAAAKMPVWGSCNASCHGSSS
jgi:hypothetical protein